MDDRREAAAGADGLEMQDGISLRGNRLGKRTVLSSLSPYHGRSVRNRGREHRIVAGAGASAFLSPFGMTYTLRREDADHADFGSSGQRDAVILSRSAERSLSKVQSTTESPCLMTMELSHEYHAKGVLPPEYVAGGGRHCGLIP